MEDDLKKAWASVTSMYPRLNRYGIQVGRGRGTGDRQLEFFHPEEPKSPRPGIPYIEVYNNAVSGDDLGNMLLGDAFHYFGKEDPEISALRERFRESITPEQDIMSRRRYWRYANPQPGDPWERNPEKRSYDKWFEISDLDQIIGGLMMGNWPAESYTEKQKFILNAILDKLRSKE